MSGDYHARDGWHFRRNPDATVTIHVADSGDNPQGDAREVTLDRHTWASAVASVSGSGETGEAYRAALAFHGEPVGAEVSIVINSRTVTVPAGALSYDDVSRLAYGGVRPGLTVVYSGAAGARAEGSLAQGDTVQVRECTIIDAVMTGNA